MALVVRGHGVPRPGDVAGVITKEHVANSVASSIQVFPTEDKAGLPAGNRSLLMAAIGSG